MHPSPVAPLYDCCTNAENYFVQAQTVLSLSCLRSDAEVKPRALGLPKGSPAKPASAGWTWKPPWGPASRIRVWKDVDAQA